MTPAGQDANDSTDLTTNYVIDPGSIGTEAGGFLTLTTPTALNDLVTIVSSIVENRTVDYQNNGDFRPVVVNGDFDRAVSLIKQISDEIARRPQFESSQQGVQALSLPAPDAGKGLVWNPAQTGFDNTTGNLNDATAEAQQSADDAAVSAGLAEAAGGTPLYIGNISNPLVDLKLKNTIDFTGAGTPTFNRSTTATFIDRYGVVQDAAIDVIRFEAEGALLEGASTNLLLWSEDFSNAVWVAGGASSKNTSAGVVTNPDSAGSTQTVEFTLSAFGTGQVRQALTTNANDKTYSFWVYITAKNGAAIIQADYGDGARKSVDISGFTDNTWNRIEFPVLVKGANDWVDIVSDVAGMTVYLYGSQFEELPDMSSYIRTTASTVARGADVFKLQQPENVIFEGLPATIVADFSVPSERIGTFKYIVEIQGVSAGARPLIAFDVVGALSGQYGMPSISTPSSVLSGRAVLTFDGSNASLYHEGVLIGTELQTSPYETDLTKVINIGGSGGNQNLFGHISRIQIFDSELSEFEALIV